MKVGSSIAFAVALVMSGMAPAAGLQDAATGAAKDAAQSAAKATAKDAAKSMVPTDVMDAASSAKGAAKTAEQAKKATSLTGADKPDIGKKASSKSKKQHAEPKPDEVIPAGEE